MLHEVWECFTMFNLLSIIHNLCIIWIRLGWGYAIPLYPRKTVYSGVQGINTRDAKGPVPLGLLCHIWVHMFGWQDYVEYENGTSRDRQNTWRGLLTIKVKKYDPPYNWILMGVSFLHFYCQRPPPCIFGDHGWFHSHTLHNLAIQTCGIMCDIIVPRELDSLHYWS